MNDSEKPECEAVMNSFIKGNFSSSVSLKCWEQFQDCSTKTLSIPLGMGSICTEYGIDISLVETASSIYTWETILATLGCQAWSAYPKDLSDPKVLVDALKDCSEIETLVFQMMASKGRSFTLLKDAVSDSAFLDFLPTVMVNICKFIFLPSGLNLRNLLWHGFLLPSEMCQCGFFLSILTAIRLTLENTMLSCGVAPKQYSFLFREQYTTLLDTFANDELLSMLSTQSLDISTIINASLFVPPGRDLILLSAAHDFRHARYISFILKVIPCLEHGLRFIFCLVNHLPDFLLAQEKTYYSTLDGFGQKSKHQLLLHPQLHEDCLRLRNCPDQVNRLPFVLGEGLYSLLLDLFFTEMGPNLRGKFAHGEINMTSEAEDATAVLEYDHVRDLATTLFVAFVSLCDRFKRNGEVAKAMIRDYYSPDSEILENVDQKVVLGTEACEEEEEKKSNDLGACTVMDLISRVEKWTSLYHPHCMLRRDLLSVSASLTEISHILAARQNMKISQSRGGGDGGAAFGETDINKKSECENHFEVDVVIDTSNGQLKTIGLWEKQNRLLSAISWEELTSISQQVDLGAPKQVKKAANSFDTLTKNIVHVCMEYMLSIKQRIESNAGAPDKGFLGGKLATGVIHTMISGLRRHLLGHMHTAKGDFVARPLDWSVDICTEFGLLADSCFSIYSADLVPGILCCGRLCKHILEIAQESVASLVAREKLVGECTAHTSDRRQYLTLLLNLVPAVMAMCSLALQVLILHFVSPISEIPTSEVRLQSNYTDKLSTTLSVVAYISALVSSFRLCIPSVSSERVDKKSADKSLLQLYTSLTSKSFKQFMHALQIQK